MINILLTYNIVNSAERGDFTQDFEKILVDMGLRKENTNQSTYFGAYRDKASFTKDLFNAVNKMKWDKEDAVTIYYPKVLVAKPNNLPDIGRHEFKSFDSAILNHIIM